MEAIELTTKSELLSAYERELKSRFPWAHVDEKLTRYMEAVNTTLNSYEVLVNLDSEAFHAALEAVGLDKRYPLHRLRDLAA